jgi:hypothetical protein
MAFAFRNIAGDRYSRSPQLVAQSVQFVPRKLRRCPIHIDRKFHRFPPHSQILE